MQDQAREAEKQIQLEFKRLQDALLTEERLRLSELAHEEEQKIAAVQNLTENIKEDISDLKKLIVSVKKEMGNEDLPLLQVRRASFYQLNSNVRLKGCILYSGTLSFLFQNFQDLKRK